MRTGLLDTALRAGASLLEGLGGIAAVLLEGLVGGIGLVESMELRLGLVSALGTESELVVIGVESEPAPTGVEGVAVAARLGATETSTVLTDPAVAEPVPSSVLAELVPPTVRPDPPEPLSIESGLADGLTGLTRPSGVLLGPVNPSNDFIGLQRSCVGLGEASRSLESLAARPSENWRPVLSGLSLGASAPAPLKGPEVVRPLSPSFSTGLGTVVGP